MPKACLGLKSRPAWLLWPEGQPWPGPVHERRVPKACSGPWLQKAGPGDSEPRTAVARKGQPTVRFAPSIHSGGAERPEARDPSDGAGGVLEVRAAQENGSGGKRGELRLARGLGDRIPADAVQPALGRPAGKWTDARGERSSDRARAESGGWAVAEPAAPSKSGTAGRSPESIRGWSVSPGSD